ncbi:MAG: lipopolysaccharide heptosyltransferase family protein [Ignavibacteriales bacterium]|nr:MAG: lipopolysaccharide heptosyltransferase family protein [Ignavibacteriales bacterium]
MITPRNILVIRIDRIGDVVLTLPIAGIIKKKFPYCKVSFLTRNYTRPLIENQPFVDNALTLIEENGKIPLLKNIRLIKSLGFDSCLVVYPTFKISLITFLSGIKNRIGTGYRWYSFLFTHKNYEHRKEAVKHELEYNINLLKFIGIENNFSRKNISFDLKVNSNAELKTEQLLSDFQICKEKPMVIVHPGSGGSAVDLPFARMKELVLQMAQDLDVDIVLTGTKTEKELCEKLKIDMKVTNMAGKLELNELIALISKCNLLIANSTGPIHIAAALGKNVIGFYPKVKVCSPLRWGPYTEKSVVFQPEINCNDCTVSQCEKLNCMDSINIKKVFDTVKNFLILSETK